MARPAASEVVTMSLAELSANVLSCELCTLAASRTHAVPGEGSVPARVMLIGEAPGATEDAQGRPFVGAAGKRLDELLGLARLNRDEVFITNVVKCRPPGNRRPHVEEIDACAAYLQRQLALVRPELVVTLGDAALKTLGGKGSVTSLHGQVLRKRRYALFVTFHPAAALHNPAIGPLLEQDFRRLGKHLQVRGPERLEAFLTDE